MRIALAQVNATVGDLAGNTGLLVAWTRRPWRRVRGSSSSLRCS